jgi:hypothetical protein
VQISGAAQASGRTVQISVEDGRLVGEMDGRGKQVLIASSETEFSGSTDWRAVLQRRPVREARVGQLPLRPSVTSARDSRGSDVTPGHIQLGDGRAD